MVIATWRSVIICQGFFVFGKRLLGFPTKERIGHRALPKDFITSLNDLSPKSHFVFILCFRWTVNAPRENVHRHRIAPV